MTTTITLLTKPACGLCEHAKATLERVGNDYDIAIAIVGLETVDGAALAAASGLLFPPGVLLNGQPFSFGRLSERRLRRALDRSHEGSGAPEPPQPAGR